MHEALVAYTAGRLSEQAEMHDVQEAPCSGRAEIHAGHTPASKQAQKEGPRHGSEIHYCPANSNGGENTMANLTNPKCTKNTQSETTATGPPPCCLSKTWMPLLAPFGCPCNNWLYRSGLDPLSATNLCYVFFFIYSTIKVLYSSAEYSVLLFIASLFQNSFLAFCVIYF